MVKLGIRERTNEKIKRRVGECEGREIMVECKKQRNMTPEGHKKIDEIGIYKTLCEVWGIGGDPVFRKGPRRKGYLTAVMSETSGVTGGG